MSERRPLDRARSPDTIVVDIDDIEEFDLEASLVPSEPVAEAPVPVLAQGSETHDRSAVAKRLEKLSKVELDALLFKYLLDGDGDEL